MLKKVVAVIMAAIVAASTTTVAFADYTYNGAGNSQITFNQSNTDRPYNNLSIYDSVISSSTSLGLKPVDIGSISDMKAVSANKEYAPSYDELASQSGDIINVNASKVLYGMGTIVDQINYKQITIKDFEAISWSFIISQFATPYEENLSDVLEHPVFKQMISEDLEITATPTAGAGTVLWNDVFTPGTQVVDRTRFSEVAKTIRNNLQYRVLYDSTGTNQINLFKFLTSDMGTVFYVKDISVGFEGVSGKELWDKRQDLMTNYKSENIVVEQKLVPVYVQSNVTMIQNQINLGSFLKGQAALPGSASSISNGTAGAQTAFSGYGGAEPTFASIIGTVSDDGIIRSASGTMGSNPMYIDSFGNICVYHENKMKIVLCNAQNSIFTSRPDEDDECQTDVIETAIGGIINMQDIPNVVEVPMHFLQQAQGVSSGAAGQKSVIPPIYTDPGIDSTQAVVKSNEAMAVYSKPVLTTYSQTLSSGAWDSDRTVHFVGDNVRNDYPGYLDYHRQNQNSHRNQMIIFKPPTFDLGDIEEAVDENPGILLGQGSSPSIYVGLKWCGDTEVIYEGLNMKTDLMLAQESDWLEDLMAVLSQKNPLKIPTQKTMFFKNGLFRNWGTNDTYTSSTVNMTAPVLYLANVKGYMKKNNATAYPYYNKLTSMNGGVAPTALQFDMMNVYNHMFMVGMGFDKNKMIPGTLIADNSNGTNDHIDEARNYTLGGMLIPSMDYGQYWSVVNQANESDAMVNGFEEKVSTSMMSGISGPFDIKNGLFKPANKILWTFTESEYIELQGIINSYLEENGDLGNLDGFYRYEPYRDFMKDGNKTQHIFVDNIFFQMRDLRISDAWVTYSAEEVALISYTWLNYYLPKSLFPRTFIKGTYEESPIFQELVNNYNVGISDSAEAALVAQRLAEQNFRDRRENTAYIDGTTDRKWPDTQVILGPWLDIHGDGLDAVMEYKFYPDTAPMPAVVKAAKISADGSSTETVYSDHVKINVYDLLMALYCNTDATSNEFQTGLRGPEAPTVDKNEILQGLYQFVKHPANTLVSWVTSFLQSAHRSLANGSFGDFFQVGWITDTSVWATIFQYYFIVVLSLVAIASIYLFFNYFLDRTVGLFTTIKKFTIGVAITLVPVLLMNGMVYGLDAISKSQLDTLLDKASVAESAALISGVNSSGADIGAGQQLFREQFDSLESILGKYGYQLPISYYKSVDQFRYSNIDLQTRLFDTAWTSNQNKGKWYDYRAFVPVQRDRYSEDLYFYFYDYIKWQYLQYAATTPAQGTSLKIQDRAAEYVFGSNLDYLGGNIGDIQRECLDPNIAWVDSIEKAEYIEKLETLMLQSRGNFAVMMSDPNYIYGESFTKSGYERFGDYYLEDMFGLGYLLTDVKQGNVSPDGMAVADKSEDTGSFYDSNWEVSDELYKYPGWIRFREHKNLVRTTDKATGISGMQNQAVIVNSYDQQLRKSLPTSELSRQGLVYGSQNALFHAINYNVAIHGTIRYTPLEKQLFDLNTRIYNRVNDIIRFFPADTPDEAYIALAALAATFEFHKEFGGGTTLQTNLEPTGFKASTITLDSVLKGLFAKDISDILQSRELMYMLVDNAGGFGIAACIIVMLADVFAFVVVITRNILITVVFAASVILCILNYMLRKDLRNKTILGVLTQCAGLCVAHLLTAFGLNLLTFYSIGSASLWKDVMIAGLVALIFFVDAMVHCTMLYMLMKDFGSFGGNIVASKLQNLKASFAGAFDGKNATFRDAKFRQMAQEDAQQAVEQKSDIANLNKLNEKLDKLDQSINRQTAAINRQTFASHLKKNNYAQAVMSRSQKVSRDITRASKTMERSVPNVLGKDDNGENLFASMKIGSDSRFNTQAVVSNPGVLDRSMGRSEKMRGAKMKQISAKSAMSAVQGIASTAASAAQNIASTAVSAAQNPVGTAASAVMQGVQSLNPAKLSSLKPLGSSKLTASKVKAAAVETAARIGISSLQHSQVQAAVSNSEQQKQDITVTTGKRRMYRTDTETGKVLVSDSLKEQTGRTEADIQRKQELRASIKESYKTLSEEQKQKIAERRGTGAA